MNHQKNFSRIPGTHPINPNKYLERVRRGLIGFIGFILEGSEKNAFAAVANGNPTSNPSGGVLTMAIYNAREIAAMLPENGGKMSTEDIRREQAFRRGFIYAVNAVLDALPDSPERRQILDWHNDELMPWRDDAASDPFDRPPALRMDGGE